MLPDKLEKALYWVNERERIRIEKEVNQSPKPWTTDRIFQTHKFCNVFREDDRNTRWLRENVREPLRNDPDVLMAIVIFRWFNLIETGETLLKHKLYTLWDSALADRMIRPQPKWITSAYVIKSPNGYDKLTGIRWAIDQMWPARKDLYKTMLSVKSLQKSWDILKEFPYMGPFMAYEVITDLRHTHVLEDADDILTWANPGPGCMRGLNRLHGRELKYTSRKHDWQSELQDLMKFINDHSADYVRSFEMRDAEGLCCEFDKYLRIENGEGSTRCKYDGCQ